MRKKAALLMLAFVTSFSLFASSEQNFEKFSDDYQALFQEEIDPVWNQNKCDSSDNCDSTDCQTRCGAAGPCES